MILGLKTRDIGGKFWAILRQMIPGYVLVRVWQEVTKQRRNKGDIVAYRMNVRNHEHRHWLACGD